MFGLSTRETLVRAIENACRNEICVYKNCVKDGLAHYSEWSEEEISRHALLARREYANAVFDAMLESFRVSSPIIDARIKLVIWNPRVTGVPDEIDTDYLADNGFSAGVTYAICYFAVTNKKINPSKDFKIISALNHYQTKLMNDALDELDKN
ncbi:hypothetical protein MM59RIKEN_26990 [Pusillibacter faecalis]|uniref:Uncharacterized protein n=1 Tax=Pusillibacter faecalis TaxID=2714358 RepID=A0A810QAT6_9FIRM|nr:hypothetical protein MM59RIKEN_26990 [Pusillibacter faecalis]